jgi:hypothetical protein
MAGHLYDVYPSPSLRTFLNCSMFLSVDAVEDYQEEAKALVEALLEANALELLVQRLGSLDEKVKGRGGGVGWGP